MWWLGVTMITAVHCHANAPGLTVTTCQAQLLRCMARINVVGGSYRHPVGLPGEIVMSAKSRFSVEGPGGYLSRLLQEALSIQSLRKAQSCVRNLCNQVLCHRPTFGDYFQNALVRLREPNGGDPLVRGVRKGGQDILIYIVSYPSAICDTTDHVWPRYRLAYLGGA
jgi:hypothetical protein